MDFVSWLEGLPRDTATKLYASHWACQAILRGLPPIAKQYVLRLLFLDAPVPSSALRRGPMPCLARWPRLRTVLGVAGALTGLTCASTLWRMCDSAG